MDIHAGAPIVCFGDSLTSLGRWPDALSARFGIPFLNAGVGGNTSAQGLSRFDRDVAPHAPQAVLISFCTNDQVIYDPAVGPQVSPAQFEQNLHTIARRCEEIGAHPVFLIMGAVEETAYYSRHPRAWCEPYGGVQALLTRYRRIVRTVAAAHKAPLIDLEGFCAAHRDELLGTPNSNPAFDGVHPSNTGWELLTARIAEQAATVFTFSPAPDR